MNVQQVRVDPMTRICKDLLNAFRGYRDARDRPPRTPT